MRSAIILGSAAVAALAAPAPSAVAMGIGNPMGGNECEATSGLLTAEAPGQTTPGAAQGNASQNPTNNPFTHCGDLDIIPTSLTGLDVQSLLF